MENNSKYDLFWLENTALDKKPKQKAGKRQWFLCGWPICSVEENPIVEKYAKTKILGALNSEDSFGKLLYLKEKWYKGKVKETMEEEIENGTYSKSTRWIYKTSKEYCCFVDVDDPTHILNISANEAVTIKKMREYGNPSSMIIEAMRLNITEKELDEYLAENVDGNLDQAFKFIVNISNQKGLVNYKDPSQEILQNKTLYDFKITVGV